MTGAWRRAGPRGALLLALAAAGCGPADDQGHAAATTSLTVVDAEGRRVELAGPARRIVSLVPSATLTLAALGAEAALVARTDFDTASWTGALPSVGGGLQPSLEAIVATRPDLVVRFGGPQDTRTPAGLDGLGIPHLAIRPDGIDGILQVVELLGEATGRTAEAAAVTARLRAGLDSVRAAAHGRPRVRAAYVLSGETPWAAGPGTYIHELIELAGGTNVFSDLGSLYAAVSLEEFMAREIDVVLTPNAARLDARIRERARVVEVGDALELHGPAVAEAAWAMLSHLHGTAPP